MTSLPTRGAPSFDEPFATEIFNMYFWPMMCLDRDTPQCSGRLEGDRKRGVHLMRARMGLFITFPPLWKFITMDRTSCDVLREKVHVVATTATARGYYQNKYRRYGLLYQALAATSSSTSACERVLRITALRGGYSYDDDSILRLTRGD